MDRPATPPRHTGRPVTLHGVLYRVLERADRQCEVEEWAGLYWLPSLMPLYRARQGLPATDDVLFGAGVPLPDWAHVTVGWVTPTLARLTHMPSQTEGQPL